MAQSHTSGRTTSQGADHLVARELEDELRKPGRSAAEVIDGIVEEVQGFDLVAEALRAAAGITCFDDWYPAPARAALTSAWLELQNVPDTGYDSLIAYAAARPTAVLDAAETAWEGCSGSRRREWLIGALLDTRGRPRVSAALDQRIPTWLARWCREPRRLGGRDEQEEKRLRRGATRLADKLAGLTSVERELLDRSCVEVADPEAARLDAAAALLMAERSQARFAEAVLAWAFALYSDRERAALAWTEALTLIAQTRAPDEAYDALTTQFSEAEQVKLTLAIVTIDGWNRFAVGFRSVHPAATSRAAA